MQVNDTYMKMLYEAERAIAGANELSIIGGKAKSEYDKYNKELENAKKSKQINFPLTLVLLGITIVLFFGSAASINEAIVLRNLCRILLVVAVFALLAILSEVITAPGKIKRAEAGLAKAQQDLANYERMVQLRITDLHVGLQLYKTMMPKECMAPQYARKYISFFENRQATTEAEARNLFDLFLHRERMEGLAAQQLASTQASNAAIIAAANRAADAANAAASATRDLNQTANYIRSK